ncbi:transketolase family protein [Bacteroidota bacterium]
MSKELAPRDVLSSTFIDIGKSNPDLVLVDADFGTASQIWDFKKEFPERFIQVGIAEQNMMGIAAGLSTVGLVPFVSTIAAFCSRRACDQVTVSIGLSGTNVKILGLYAGLFVGKNGASHQSLEDIAIMRAIANMSVVQPADAVETEQVLRYAADYEGPMYIRVGRDPVKSFLPEDYKFELGKSVVLKEGKDVTLMVYGDLVEDAMEAAEMLSEKGISARVLNMSSIKPIDEDAIVKAAEETGGIVTIDNHNIHGGLGSAVAEVLTEKCPVKMKRMGVKNEFGKSGSNEEMKRVFGLRAEDIVNETVKYLEEK